MREDFANDLRRVWSPIASTTASINEHWVEAEKVDRTIVVAFAAPASGLNVPNEYVADYVKKHEEKLIGFASVDPRDPRACVEFEHSIRELGLKGLKLGPIYQQFDPTDRRYYPLYDKAEELEVPILWHMGATFVANSPLRYSQPILLDEISAAFEGTKMIIAHMGHPWYEEAAVVVRKQPNVYADVAGIHFRPWQLYNMLRCAMEYGVEDKLLFGTDFPFATVESTIEGLKRVNRVVDGTCLPQIPRQVVERIIQRDSLKILGLG